MEVSLAKMRNLMSLTARPISLETPMGEEGESRWVDYIEDWVRPGISLRRSGTGV
jgi:DNA-directed RNA polymerase sigma subunit (sigma70/sigma32)